MRTPLSWRRLRALCIKESRQIVRDPSAGLIAFVLPLVLLVIIGYGINLDSEGVRLGLLVEDRGAEAEEFASNLEGSPYFRVYRAATRDELDYWLEEGLVRGYVALAADFSAAITRGSETAPVQLVTDGAEPNTANLLLGYVQGAWQRWQIERARSLGMPPAAAIEVHPRQWFNPAAESRHYLIPGSITIIMTVIGAMLTSLVVAREWERGTMEALLASPVTRAELLLSKLLPYYVLGLISMTVITVSAVFLLGVPFRGSVPVLFGVTSVFLFSVLGIGLLISSTLRNQFNSAQTALSVAFLPSVILSGVFFEIASMPAPVRALTFLLPPRYFVTALRTEFLAGDLGAVIWPDVLFLAATGVLFLALVVRWTPRRLDG